MTSVSARLRRRIERDFPQPGSAEEVARIVAGAYPTERIQAAVVFWAAGDLARLQNIVELAGLDWRDALMRTVNHDYPDLANEGWAERLDRELGPA